MSIENLIDTYKGNPAPLANKVQQDQRNQPSGALTPDLEEALALQQIQELQNAKQAQLALQAGGPQPTILEKLRQLLGQSQGQPQGGPPQGPMAQGMPPRMPPQGFMAQGMPPRMPQGINQLPTNIGQHMAGGGIVAFAGDDERVGSEVPEPKHKYRQYTLQEQGANWEAQRQAARDAEDAKRSPEARQDSEGIMKALGFVFKDLPTKAAGALSDLSLDALKTLVSAPGYGFSKNTPAAEVTPPGVNPVTGQPISQAALAQGVAPMIPQATRAETGQAPAPRPLAAQGPRVPPAPADQPASQGLGALLEQSVRQDLGRDRDAEAQKMVDKHREISGMSDYQKQMAEIMKAAAAQQEEAKSNRTPEWVRAAQNIGSAPIRGGIGMLLGKLGQGATAARDTYAAEDAAYVDKLSTLKRAAMDAQLKGNMELAKTYSDQYKEVDAARRSALTSGTSLENTRENVAQRKQTSADALAGRMQAAQFQKENRATAAADKIDAHYREQAMRLAMIAAKDAKADMRNSNKLKDVTAEELAASKFDAIYNALKTGKMTAAPGAPRPGGTPADISALLNKYGGK
jgi:hypothetical protein